MQNPKPVIANPECDRETLLHELMNRAAPLLALAERLRAIPLPEEHRAVLSALYRSSRDVERLVRSLRDPEDFFVPQRVELDVGALCAEVVDGLRGAARAAGMRLMLDLGGAALVMADEVQLAEIVTNLVKNALEAGRPGGSVVVRTEARGRYVRLVVRDDGPGLSPEVAGRLFQRGASTKSRRDGAPHGIGLSLSRQLARAHGGRLLHRRVNEGAGYTEFVVSLPRVRAAEACAAPLQCANDVMKPRVLVVEDDPEVRFALELILRDDFAITAVADGDAALRALREAEFDAMLTDENLPRGPGGAALYEAAIAIQPSLRGRVIIVSGEARPRAESPELPRIRKPFNATALRRALQERLAAAAL